MWAVDLHIHEIVHAHTGLFQRQLDRVKDLSGLLLRIVWSFADGWVDTQMAAEVRVSPSSSPGLKGSLATLLPDIVVGCCARETVGVSNANVERRGTIKKRFNQ